MDNSPLRLARKRRRLALREVAALVGIGKPHLARVEAGLARASTPVALRLAAVFPELTRDQILFPEFYVDPPAADVREVA